MAAPSARRPCCAECASSWPSFAAKQGNSNEVSHFRCRRLRRTISINSLLFKLVSMLIWQPSFMNFIPFFFTHTVSLSLSLSLRRRWVLPACMQRHRATCIQPYFYCGASRFCWTFCSSPLIFLLVHKTLDLHIAHHTATRNFSLKNS